MSTEISAHAKSAKMWSVNTTSTANEPLKMFVAGRPLTQTGSATIDGVSPVELLLLSVATCYALSCRAALLAKKLALVEFDVSVSGLKAIDLPSRLESIRLVVAFGEGVPGAAVAGLAAHVKRLCTVTNTLQATPLSIEVEVRRQ